MSAVDRAARVLTLVPILVSEGRTAIDDLAARLGVDRATVVADLEMLDFCGLPGLGGGDLFEVHVGEDFVSLFMAPSLERTLRLSPGEALRILMAGEAAGARVTAELGGNNDALDRALDKVRTVAGIGEGVLQAARDHEPDGLDVVREAISNRMQLHIDYQGRTDEDLNERVVEPWRLTQHGRWWYLDAWDCDRAGMRRFRLDRVAAVLATDIPATEPVGQASDEIPAYVPNDADIEVTIETDPEGRWLASILSAAHVEELDGERLRITARTDALAWLARLVVVAGGHARVVHPPEAVAAVLEVVGA